VFTLAEATAGGQRPPLHYGSLRGTNITGPRRLETKLVLLTAERFLRQGENHIIIQ
jgi:hypothetical protein